MQHYYRINEIKEQYKTKLDKKSFGNGLNSSSQSDTLPFAVQGAVNYIKEYLYEQKLTVNWLREHCRIKGKNFAGRFKYYVSKSPKQYILYHRIETAKMLLKDTALEEISVFEIAMSVGFQNHSAFTTTFKQYVGITPKEFREQFLKEKLK